MKKIAITTDSNSGILPEEYKDKGVFVLPMPFLINDEAYFENVNLTQEGFYQLLDSNASVSTSQPSYGELTDFRIYGCFLTFQRRIRTNFPPP